MLLSTKFILDGLRKWKTETHSTSFESTIEQWFINFDNSQIDKPSIVILEKEKAVVLYANDNLWEVIEKWKHKKMEDFNIIDGIKIWKEIKTIMEKKAKEKG